jgi:hypothetical protein
VVRVGLLAQPEVIAAMNEFFVAVEYDATETDTVPDDVPGMWAIRRAWETSPWTRVSFGSEWVLDPTGQYVLSTGFHKHADLPMVATLERELQKSLQRFARIRSHPRGSDAEQVELERVVAEIDSDMALLRPCWVDSSFGTLETLRVVATEDPATFESRLAGVFTYPDPVVRRQAAEALETFMRSGRDAEFSPDHLLFLERRMVALLDDEDTAVRLAAARAVFAFERLSTPASADDDELVAGAARLWTPEDEQATAARAAAAASTRGH